MRYLALFGALALAGCSSMFGTEHETARAAPAQNTAYTSPPISHSPHVMAGVVPVQQKLVDAGLYHGPVDGLWGAKTIAATRAYQQANDLPVTGEADHATRVKMGLEQPVE